MASRGIAVPGMSIRTRSSRRWVRFGGHEPDRASLRAVERRLCAFREMDRPAPCMEARRGGKSVEVRLIAPHRDDQWIEKDQRAFEVPAPRIPVETTVQLARQAKMTRRTRSMVSLLVSRGTPMTLRTTDRPCQRESVRAVRVNMLSVIGTAAAASRPCAPAVITARSLTNGAGGPLPFGGSGVHQSGVWQALVRGVA